jgi:hypothetical protein
MFAAPTTTNTGAFPMMRLILAAAAAPRVDAQDLGTLEKESVQLTVEKGEIATKLEHSAKAARDNDHDFDVQEFGAVNPGPHTLKIKPVPPSWN